MQVSLKHGYSCGCNASCIDPSGEDVGDGKTSDREQIVMAARSPTTLNIIHHYLKEIEENKSHIGTHRLWTSLDINSFELNYMW